MSRPRCGAFRRATGFPPTGGPGTLTFNALNVPADQRLSQLKTNLARLRAFDTKPASRFVVCNIPAAQLEAIENGTVMSRHIAVVGKPDRPSPDINSRIVEINFNPYWTVPVSIVRKDLIPKMQAEPDYLTKNKIRILDPKNNELTPAQINWFSEEAVNYKFKQDPGDLNSLGSIRINFPSQHGVYMHDTPYKNLFGEDVRFHSSGCMRIQNVRDLVSWMLSETQRLVAHRDRRGDQVGRAQGRQAQDAGAAALGLRHRLVDRRRRRAVSRRHLQPRRSEPARERVARIVWLS